MRWWDTVTGEVFHQGKDAVTVHKDKKQADEADTSTLMYQPKRASEEETTGKRKWKQG